VSTDDTSSSGSISGGVSGGVSGKGRGTPDAFKRGDHGPDHLVQVRITAAARDRFDDWFENQYPGVTQRPSKDPWVDRVFQLGLDRIEKLMPPALSPEDRLAAAMNGDS
jgi:hypothetical protein